MSKFTTFLGLQLYEDAKGDAILRDGRCQWTLLEPLVYDVGAEGSGETITVPVGFITDLASIPFPFRNLLPPDGPWAKAAVVHDYLYWTRGLTSLVLEEARPPFYDRAQADDILKEAMEVVGVPSGKRQIIWAAVRLGGAKGWGS